MGKKFVFISSSCEVNLQDASRSRSSGAQTYNWVQYNGNQIKCEAARGRQITCKAAYRGRIRCEAASREYIRAATAEQIAATSKLRCRWYVDANRRRSRRTAASAEHSGSGTRAGKGLNGLEGRFNRAAGLAIVDGGGSKAERRPQSNKKKRRWRR
jgi:hypothetical protein